MRINVDGSELDTFIEDNGYPGDKLMEAIEAAIERLKADPGGINEEITLVIANDFEEEESEDDESEDTTATEKEG